MFFLYPAMTCSLKLNISKCDQFLQWQKPLKLFKKIDCTWAAQVASSVADLEQHFLALVGKRLLGRWG